MREDQGSARVRSFPTTATLLTHWNRTFDVEPPVRIRVHQRRLAVAGLDN